VKQRFPIFAVLIFTVMELTAASLTVSSPADWQVVQRMRKSEGKVRLAGQSPTGTRLEWRVSGKSEHGKVPGGWQKISTSKGADEFATDINLPAGGWYRLEVRAMNGEEVLAGGVVEHVGVGEVFVVAGQSNAGNHGEKRQTNRTGLVSAFSGSAWQLAVDPQPGASGNSGSFMPPFGDAMAERFKVPIGIVACGIGATSVREWLPKGATFPNPPTIEKRVEQLPGGEWASKGEAYEMFTARMKQLGPRGFRAVLWHQGESDANQKDPSRTLAGKLYTQHLSRIIRDSRRAVGWDAQWFVAQASYHVPGDESSPDIRAAQKAVCDSGLAVLGPDTDELKGVLRERQGRGVHFSGEGLRAHAARWFERVSPWLDKQLNR